MRQNDSNLRYSVVALLLRELLLTSAKHVQGISPRLFIAS